MCATKRENLWKMKPLFVEKNSGTPFVDDHQSDIQAKSLERATNKGSLWKMKSSLVEKHFRNSNCR